jgi:hypothetical protein
MSPPACCSPTLHSLQDLRQLVFMKPGFLVHCCGWQAGGGEQVSAAARQRRQHKQRCGPRRPPARPKGSGQRGPSSTRVAPARAGALASLKKAHSAHCSSLSLQNWSPLLALPAVSTCASTPAPFEPAPARGPPCGPHLHMPASHRRPRARLAPPACTSQLHQPAPRQRLCRPGTRGAAPAAAQDGGGSSRPSPPPHLVVAEGADVDPLGGGPLVAGERGAAAVQAGGVQLAVRLEAVEHDGVA